MAASSGPTITNIIVVMLENRSYDNVLGALYDPSNPAPPGQTDLNGLTGAETNPAISSGGQPVQVMNQKTTTDGNTNASYSGTTVPLFDPGEYFSDMAQQIMGGSAPTSNPYQGTWPPDSTTLMQGFTPNYTASAQQVPVTNQPDVMNYFTPAQVPVTAWLARNFAVCDQWFASVPTQTFTNRAFAHCAAPGVHPKVLFVPSFSLVDDLQYVTDSLDELPSVFSQLDATFPNSASASPPNWKVYFHDYSISMKVCPYVKAQAESSENVNVSTYDNSDWGSNVPTGLGALPPTFAEDLADNKLPMYSFIEPRYSNNYAPNSNSPNSNHPGAAGYLDGVVSSDNPPIDVADGEAFLLQLYNALFSPTCSYRASSLLIITYDEHGGLYDHVVPPSVPSSAVPPGSNIPAVSNDADTMADGFNFNVYGCRVPAIIVSPFIAAGTTITPPDSTPFDHASILKTVWDCFGISDSLTSRDAAAPSLYPFLSSTADNNPGQCPVKLGSDSE